MHANKTTPLLGDISPERFLRAHWQRKPRLIRNAFPQFRDLLTREELMQLACREECRSRLAIKQGRTWQVHHGPFQRKQLRQLPARGWALLVQDVNLVLRAAHDLLMQFNFVPYARLDDLMISLAPDGGGVGPHFDSYDVFLLQGLGKRRWELSTQTDLSLIESAPLKVLKRFKPQRKYVLDPGDMLYLPPGVAHNGVALGACMTYSIGFRSPTLQELVSAFLAHLDDDLQIAGRYEDPNLDATATPAQIPSRMTEAALSQINKLDFSRDNVTRFLGRYLTEPQPHVVFNPPSASLSRRSFASALRRAGVELDLRTRMLWSDGYVFINGERIVMDPTQAPRLRPLADRRMLGPGHAVSVSETDQLYAWYRAGYLLLGP